MSRSTAGLKLAVGNRQASQRSGLLYPLDAVYRRVGIALPRARLVTADDIPFPYRTLLVHTDDMTLTLERHFGAPIVVRPLSTLLSGHWYTRRVLLAQAYSGRPVEMGAIRINLKAFRPRTRRTILANHVPLGRLLRDDGVDFESRPRAFFALEPNAEMLGVFWMRESRELYGRRTEIFVDGVNVGDIVEILPMV